MKYFLHLAYHGTSFRGWQKQIGVVGIQELVDRTISVVLGKTTTTLGCGRTDAQVHASQYFAEFRTDKVLEQSFCFILNKILPNSIRIYSVVQVADCRNVQLDVKKRTYRYYFHTQENPFLADLSTYYNIPKFNVERVKLALALLVGNNNYRGFCKSPNKYKHTLVKVFSANITCNAKRENYCIEITANRFLRGMVRSLVYELLQIGQEKCNLKEFENRLKLAAQVPNIRLAYPQGLYLTQIEYGFLSIVPKQEIVSFLLK